MRGPRALRRSWRAALDSQARGTKLAEQNEPRGRLGGRERERDRGRESKAGRVHSGTEIGAMSPEYVCRRDCRPCVTTSSKDARGKLYRQLSKLLRPRRGPRESQIAQNGCRQTQAHRWETNRFRGPGDSGTGETREDRVRPRPRLRVWIQGSR